MNHLVLATWLLLFVGGVSARSTAAAEPSDRVVKLLLHGQKLEGRALRWSADSVDLLGRDGRLYTFAPAEARSPQRSPTRFKALSPAEVRSQLVAELGKAHEITAAGHYIVACPKGKGRVWGQQFDELYRSFVRYFSVRGIRIREPEFPLVAIVYPDQRSFLQGAARDGIQVPSSGVLGLYSPNTNRILLFDTGKAAEEQGIVVADTIIHEAAHQTAFNTGVHVRFAATPRWVCEGLGTLFEAPGVWNARSFPLLKDRINAGRFQAFQQYAATSRRAGTLAELIGSDRYFQTSTASAYAEAWALTFYLLETQPAKYSELLQRINARPPFAEYPAADRIKDFTAVFGTDLKMFEVRFLRFMADLRG